MSFLSTRRRWYEEGGVLNAVLMYMRVSNPHVDDGSLIN